MKTKLQPCFVVIAALVIAGCSGGEFPVAPVSGTVTLNGEPLTDAYITFEPRSTRDDGIAGPGSYGKTDSEGKYSLKTYEKQEGAVVGTHRVSIKTLLAEETADGESKIIRNEILPNKYHRRSELKFEVSKGGSDSANFELTN